MPGVVLADERLSPVWRGPVVVEVADGFLELDGCRPGRRGGSRRPPPTRHEIERQALGYRRCPVFLTPPHAFFENFYWLLGAGDLRCENSNGERSTNYP